MSPATQLMPSAAAKTQTAARRILYVTTISNTLHGFIGPFAHRMASEGWIVDGMAKGVSTQSNQEHSFSELFDIDWSRNPLDPRNLTKGASRIRQIVTQGHYDVVHVHTPVAAFVTRFALRNLGPNRPKVVYTAHGFHFHPNGSAVKNRIFRTVETLAGRWTDYLVVINQTDYRAAIDSQIVAAGRVRHIPGVGIDTDAFAPARVSQSAVTAVRDELGLLPSNSMFLMLAEFNPGKRHRDVLQAMALLGRSGAHLALAGYGPTMEVARQQAQSLGLAGQVHFLGMRYDVPALIRASNALILPSEREGLSRSVMESLSLEVPVIGTRVRGIQELVGERGGILVNLGDTVGLAAAMARILDHPDQAHAMGALGRQQMKQFSLGRILDAHEALYEEVTGNSCAGKLS